MSEVQSFDHDCFADSLRNAVTGQVAGMLTEPMPIKRLAEYFGVNRNLMKSIVTAMPGVEKCATLYRLPVWKMPPRYLIERGIIRSILPHESQTVPKSADVSLNRAA